MSVSTAYMKGYHSAGAHRWKSLEAELEREMRRQIEAALPDTRTPWQRVWGRPAAGKVSARQAAVEEGEVTLTDSCKSVRGASLRSASHLNATKCFSCGA